MQKKYMISNLISDLHLTVLTDGYTDKAITHGYCCDMLSWAMSRLDDSSCWFTILNSMNVVAVASLSGCPCVVLTENVEMANDVLSKAVEENICVCISKESTFYAAANLTNALSSS